MLKTIALEYIANGENSGVEFKRDDIRPEQLAREVVALANFQGGYIFLGVEDDGSISGIQRLNPQDWVLNVFRDKIFPLIIPFYEEITIDDKKIAVITIGQGVSKPYVVRNNGREEIFIRMGSRCEPASREQQARLFATSGLLHVEVLPVPGTSIDSLDLSRLDFYLREIIRDTQIPQDQESWIRRLIGLGFLVDDGLGHTVCTIAGLVCFGKKPRDSMSQCGIRLEVFNSHDKEYQARFDTVLDGPLVARRDMQDGRQAVIDDGLIEKFSSALLPFIKVEDDIVDENMQRGAKWLYPFDAARETIINALAHRDWTQAVDIEVVCYSDRMEVISPGRMQNSMTIEKMLAGQRSPRNPLIAEVLRDYGYVDSRGMGVRTKVVPLMKSQNKAEPIFELTEDYLKTILPRKIEEKNEK
ncbi:MAG: RNA-binding domain-containing protein [Sphaerochaetaceae bacterium]